MTNSKAQASYSPPRGMFIILTFLYFGSFAPLISTKLGREGGSSNTIELIVFIASYLLILCIWKFDFFKLTAKFSGFLSTLVRVGLTAILFFLTGIVLS